MKTDGDKDHSMHPPTTKEHSSAWEDREGLTDSVLLQISEAELEKARTAKLWRGLFTWVFVTAII